MLICWIVLPLVLSALALGCGLLLERAAGTRLSGALLLPSGLAVMVVVGLFTVMSDSTAELTTPLVLLLAATGLILSPPWRRGPLDPWVVGCAVAVFALYAAPVVLSGEPTFASYLSQPDTGTWLGLTDHVMNHGRNIAGVPDSNYRDILNAYLPGGYPLGSFLPFGVGTKLLGQDPAWLFQPYLAFLSAMLALSLYALGARVFTSVRLRALGTFVASQPALLYAMALWSGIKELSGAGALALLAALLIPVVREGVTGRGLLPISVASAAVLGLLSFAGGIWLVPLLAGGLVLSIRLRSGGVAVAQAATFFLIAGLLSIPTLAEIGSFLPNATSNVVTGGVHALLFHPLSWRQLFAIWPAGDFRGTADSIGLTDVLVGLVVIAAVAGLIWAWMSQRWELLLYAGGLAVACLVIVVFGSPWVDAKALAIASPAIAFAAMAGVLALPLHLPGNSRSPSVRSARVVGPIAAALITAGVLWSNALAYHDVTLAPRADLRELEKINDRFGGRGPTLLTDYEPYAGRHFLRNMDVQGTSGLKDFRVPLGGNRYVVAQRLDLRLDTEGYEKQALLNYRTIVRRHNPASSYPAYAFRLVWSGRYWEVWQRTGSPRPIVHLPLGAGGQPVNKPSCSRVLSLARSAGPTGTLAYSERPTLNEALIPPKPVWTSNTKGTAVPEKLRSGVITGSIEVPAAEKYAFWMSGVFDRRVQLFVDGRALEGPRREYVFSYPNYVFMGSSNLSKGTHSLELRYGDKGILRPGTGGRAAISPSIGAKHPLLGFGPILFSREDPSWRVAYLKPSEARTLCGRTLDWIEAIQ